MSWLKSVFKLVIVLVVVYQVNCENSLLCNQGIYTSACTLENLKFIDKFNLTSMSTRYKYNMYYLTIKNSSFPKLPTGIFKDLLNVNTVNIVNCGVLEISRNDFENGKKLRMLDLSQNAITKLDEDIFSGATSLERITLTSNQINQIHPNAFRNLYKLHLLKLADNKIKELPSDVFTIVKTLSILDLSHNLIEKLPNDDKIFTNLNFINLDLSSNQLTMIGQQTLANIKYVRDLDLSYNQIDNLSLNGLKNIENIMLNNNQMTNLVLNGNIKKIQADNNKIANGVLFATTDNDANSNVISLSLKNNSLSSIEFVRNQVNLTYLDVSFNPLVSGSTKNDTFTKLAKLKSLYMESVNLNEIDYVLFAQLTNLEILDLSYNNLLTIDFHKLSILENLKQLFINSNNLTGLTLDEFKYLFPNFNLIDFSDNNFMCKDLVEILKTLKPLNIRIYVETNKLAVNEGIRGIRCNNENTTQPSSTNGMKRPVFIHPHDINSADFNLSQIALHLKQLQDANDNTQYQLGEILSNLDFNNLDLYAEELNQTKIQMNELKGQLDQILAHLKERNDEPNNSTYFNQYLRQIDKLNKTLEYEIRTIKLEDSVNHDIKFIKVVLTLLFICGIIFGAFKVATFYLRRQSSNRISHYKTMGVNLDENNF